MKRIVIVIPFLLLAACHREEPQVEKPVTPVRVTAVDLYQPKGGEVFLKGIFQQTTITQQRKLFYDGSAIHWKHGQLLRPLKLDCIAGGRPPLVADCQASPSRSN